MNARDRVKLVFGPYRPQRLRRGDRLFCLLRDCDVIITGWSDGRIPWPRCRALRTHGGGSGLLLDEELARAVRPESSLAVQCWFGVAGGVVWRWRKALGVGQWEPERSRRLHQELSERGAAALKERGLSEEECGRRSKRSRELNIARFLPTGYHGPRWTAAEEALLGMMADKLSRRASAGLPRPCGFVGRSSASPTRPHGPGPTAHQTGRLRRTSWFGPCRPEPRPGGPAGR